jgi:peroxiredoxin
MFNRLIQKSLFLFLGVGVFLLLGGSGWKNKWFDLTFPAERTQILVGEGDAAPLFSAPDTAGKMFSLKSLRGQYVLIEFWASWCGICYPRNQEIITMIKEINAERAKPLNLTVLMVSLDSRKDKWVSSIKKQHIEQYIQVCDYGGWDSEIATLYGVTKLPANFLVDPNGQIKEIDVFDSQMRWVLEKIKD